MRIRECRQTLARAHYQVGYFYQKTRRSWRSAIGRYETILSQYPDYERSTRCCSGSARCLSFAGRYAEARPQLARLRNEFPESPYRGRGRQARSHLSTLGARCSAGPPATTPAPPHRRLRPPNLKCNFEDSSKHPLTTSLFS